jgi:hypothetical protein
MGNGGQEKLLLYRPFCKRFSTAERLVKGDDPPFGG